MWKYGRTGRYVSHDIHVRVLFILGNAHHMTIHTHVLVLLFILRCMSHDYICTCTIDNENELYMYMHTCIHVFSEDTCHMTINDTINTI